MADKTSSVERVFGTSPPTGDRIVYHKSPTLGALKTKLLEAGYGYTVVNEVVDGVTVPPLPDGLKHYTFMTSILHNHSLELREWLAENGCVCKCGQLLNAPVSIAAEECTDASNVDHHAGGDVVSLKA